MYKSAYLNRVFDDASKKYANEPDFLNAVREFFNSMDYIVEDNKEIEKNLEVLNKEKLDLNSSLTELETTIKKMNTKFNSLTSEINTLEINITKYNMT